MRPADDTGTVLTDQGLPQVLGGRIEAVEPLRHNQGNAATGGIWAVHGPAGSAVLKVVRPPAGHPVGSPSWQTSDEPTHWNYWRREALAYTTGFAGRVYAEAGIVAPRLLTTAGRADGAIELWLARAGGTPGMSWSVRRLAAFATQLGVAQAGFVERVPRLPWLSRDWLGQYLAHGPARGVAAPGGELWEHPVAAVWPGAVRSRLRGLWARRDQVRAVVAAAPRTLCHLDVWPTNLIEDGATSVLVDWSFTGEGALGEDVANLIVDSVTDGLMDSALLPGIAAEVTDGYLAGLRAGGWTGSPDVVRRCIEAAGAAKYSWFAPAVLGRLIRDGSLGSRTYGRAGAGLEELDRLLPVVHLLADWAAGTE